MLGVQGKNLRDIAAIAGFDQLSHQLILAFPRTFVLLQVGMQNTGQFAEKPVDRGTSQHIAQCSRFSPACLLLFPLSLEKLLKGVVIPVVILGRIIGLLLKLCEEMLEHIRRALCLLCRTFRRDRVFVLRFILP